MYTPMQYRRSPNYLERHPLMNGGMGDAGSSAASAAGSLASAGISAGVQLATSAAQMWMQSIQLSHTADTATTQIVNGLAPLLQQNVNAYLAGPGTCADQAAALSAYLSAVQWLYSNAGCGNGAYGSAGNRCISDRFGPGGATDANAKYPWANYYYYPILNDPRAAGCAAANAAADPNAAEQSAVTNIQNLITGSPAQTTPGTFATGGTASTTGSSPAAASTTASTSTIAGIPTTYVLVGGGILALILLMK